MRRVPERTRFFDKAAENGLEKIRLEKKHHRGAMWKLRNLKKKDWRALYRRRKKQIEREKDETRRTRM